MPSRELPEDATANPLSKDLLAGQDLLSSATPTHEGSNMPVPVWSERTIRHASGLQEYEGYKYNERTKKLERLHYTTPDMYTYFMLNAEADAWEMRVYDNPSTESEDYAEELNAIYADMFDFGITMGWAKDGKITVVKFYDNGVARPWNGNDLAPDLNTMLINMSLKSSKYMSLFSQATYANGEFRIVWVDEDDDTYYPHKEGVLYIKITELDEEEAYLHDGQFYFRKQVRNAMAENAYRRIKPHDLKKAVRVYDQIRHSRAFNGRMVTDRGLGKGDVLVAHNMKVDILIDKTNWKRDIVGRREGIALFQMFPQEQNGDVFTNRQSVASFYHSLLDVPTPGREDGKNLVKDALADYIWELIERFRSGEKMLHIDSVGREEKDQVRYVFQKLEAWVNAGLSLNESLYLLMMQAGQIVDMLGCTPGQDDKKRRLPVPFASRHSIRNAKTYKMVYGVDLQLEFGEAFIDHNYGIIVSDDTYRMMAPILGGADLDDHAEVHYRVAEDDSEVWNVKAGDVVMVIIRNPIGIVSTGVSIEDGQVVDQYGNPAVLGTEFVVLKAAAVERVNLPARFGELPGLKMAKLPHCSAHLDLPEATWTPDEPAIPEVYNKRYLWEQIELRSLAQAAYGTHVNMYMTCRLYNIPSSTRHRRRTWLTSSSRSRMRMALSSGTSTTPRCVSSSSGLASLWTTGSRSVLVWARTRGCRPSPVSSRKSSTTTVSRWISSRSVPSSTSTRSATT